MPEDLGFNEIDPVLLPVGFAFAWVEFKLHGIENILNGDELSTHGLGLPARTRHRVLGISGRWLDDFEMFETVAVETSVAREETSALGCGATLRQTARRSPDRRGIRPPERWCQPP